MTQSKIEKNLYFFQSCVSCVHCLFTKSAKINCVHCTFTNLSDFYNMSDAEFLMKNSFSFVKNIFNRFFTLLIPLALFFKCKLFFLFFFFNKSFYFVILKEIFCSKFCTLLVCF